MGVDTTSLYPNITQLSRGGDGTVMGQSATDPIGFYGTPVIEQQVLATGVTHTADDIITFLQLIGLVRQA